MAASWLLRTGFVVLLSLAVAPASAASPGNDLTRLTDPENTFTSPDGQVSVEQYSKKKGEDDLVYQFWAFDPKHEHGVLLNRDENTDDAGYPAGFRFSPNSQWLVRMQKTGAGYHTLFLYRRNGFQFSSATPKPLGEMPAGVQEDTSEIQGSRFARSRGGPSGEGGGRQLHLDGKALAR
jgi:hypothetical protein